MIRNGSKYIIYLISGVGEGLNLRPKVGRHTLPVTRLKPQITNNDSDKQFYVQTHNGTKEGYLYLIKNYIVFGMKKPIFVNLLEIDEISYSSITRLTFSINSKLNDKFENKKYEFSMIDHDEFSIIDNI